MELTLSDANDVLQHYDLGSPLTLTRLHSGFANQNYKLTTDRQDVLLRVCREQSDANIGHEMKLLQKLREIDFPAAYPHPRTDGGFLTPHPEGTVVLYQFIPGEEPVPTIEVVRSIGTAVARLNSNSRIDGFDRKNGLDLDLCHRVIHRFEDAPHRYPELFESFRRETALLEGPLTEDLPRGLIHGDVFPDNTIFRGNELQAILDWEEACTDTLLIDVGATVNGFCFPDNRLDHLLLSAFLEGYESVRNLTERERELLPFFIRWGAHCMIAWHLDHIMERPDSRKLERALMFTDRLANLDLA